jgi:hypothetical protein
MIACHIQIASSTKSKLCHLRQIVSLAARHANKKVMLSLLALSSTWLEYGEFLTRQVQHHRPLLATNRYNVHNVHVCILCTFSIRVSVLVYTLKLLTTLLKIFLMFVGFSLYINNIKIKNNGKGTGRIQKEAKFRQMQNDELFQCYY